MPVSRATYKLTVPQARILKCLAEADLEAKRQSPDLTGTMTRKRIAVVAKVSASMTGNLGPVGCSPTSTSKHYGRRNLMDLGYVTCEIINVEGLDEANYLITELGHRAYQNLPESTRKVIDRPPTNNSENKG